MEPTRIVWPRWPRARSAATGCCSTGWSGRARLLLMPLARCRGGRPCVLLVIATFCSLTWGVASAHAGTYEPNDRMSQAYGPLEAGMAYNGAIDTNGDDDWFVFYPKRRQQITITARDTSPSASACGSLDVSLKDARARTLASGRLHAGTSTDFPRTVNRGIYYFVVQNVSCSPEAYSF